MNFLCNKLAFTYLFDSSLWLTKIIKQSTCIQGWGSVSSAFDRVLEVGVHCRFVCHLAGVIVRLYLD